MRRGTVITVALSGDYGKPRPAIVVQSDRLADNDSVLVCLLTSTIRDVPLYRLAIEPHPETGLRVASQVMVDKIVAVRRDRCGPPIGQLDGASMRDLSRLLAFVLGLAD